MRTEWRGTKCYVALGVGRRAERAFVFARLPLAAEDFLTIMSDLAVGWLLLQQASIALKKLPETSKTHPDHAFYTGKKFAAQHFATL